MALNAAEEPRKIQPKMMTAIVVRMSELRGTPRAGWTLAKKVEKGTPRSRAKAQVMRDEVVMMPHVAKRRQTRGKMSRHTAPSVCQEQYTIDSNLTLSLTGSVVCCGVENLQQRSRCTCVDGVNRSIAARNEKKDHEEDEASEDTNADAVYHDFWTFDRSIGLEVC